MRMHLNVHHALTCTLVAALVFFGTGCDDNGTDTPPVVTPTIVGAWQMTTVILNDTPIGEITIPAAQFLAMANTGATASTLHFDEDGTASVVTTYTDSSEDTIEGTWSADGNNLTVEGAGIDDTAQFTVDATTLKLTRTMAINLVPGGPKEDIVVDMVYTRLP